MLREIGVPDAVPFTPDPFQIEALQLLEEGDVIVSAPTGSGKTYIAVQAMEKLLAQGGRSWYASPLKALSNSKYLEFGRRFGEENVGLLTGDHKVNPDAPIIVGTTEILRNQLYDAMSRGDDLASDLVVMDEAHYLGDPDRGVVWEETAIYLNPRVRLLLLSATVANAREIADWLTSIRGEKCRAVTTHERPVPLHALFLFPDGELASLSRGRSLSPQVSHFIKNNPRKKFGRGRPQTPFGRILRVMDEADLMPAIFFLKSRSDCDQALSMALRQAREQDDPQKRRRREELLDELLERYPFLKTHAHVNYIRRAGLAAHHAGHMPHWKMVVEQLMQAGLLQAIFSTSTVAAGVNFPARTVVICQSDRFNGREFLDLTATELLQMTGRAGRRGMDRIGFALVAPGPFLNPALIHSLFNAPPDPVQSRIQINFSMALNLLMSHRPDQIRTLLDRSLAAYQQGRSKQAAQSERLLSELGGLLEGSPCPDPELALAHYFTARRLENEARHLKRLRPALAWEAALSAGLTPGRVFQNMRGQFFCFLGFREKHGLAGVQAVRIKSDPGVKKGRIREKWIPLENIFGLTETVLDLDWETPASLALSLILSANHEDHVIIPPDDLAAAGDDPKLAALDQRLSQIEIDLAALPCQDCPVRGQCRDGGDIADLLQRLARLEDDGQQSGRSLMAVFRRHLEFLKLEGFVDDNDELTPDGLWAAQLRLDHPLVIAQGIRTGAWPEDDPALLAAVVAPFVVDKEQEPEEAAPGAPDPLRQAWSRLEFSVEPVIRRLTGAGFDAPQLHYRPALAVYSWASGGDWEEAVRLYGHDPGDMAMLVFRTADNLRQIARLAATHPKLAPAAKAAVELILKEPVIVPL